MQRVHASRCRPSLVTSPTCHASSSKHGERRLPVSRRSPATTRRPEPWRARGARAPAEARKAGRRSATRRRPTPQRACVGSWTGGGRPRRWSVRPPSRPPPSPGPLRASAAGMPAGMHTHMRAARGGLDGGRPAVQAERARRRPARGPGRVEGRASPARPARRPGLRVGRCPTLGGTGRRAAAGQEACRACARARRAALARHRWPCACADHSRHTCRSPHRLRGDGREHRARTPAPPPPHHRPSSIVYRKGPPSAPRCAAGRQAAEGGRRRDAASRPRGVTAGPVGWASGATRPGARRPA